MAKGSVSESPAQEALSESRPRFDTAAFLFYKKNVRLTKAKVVVFLSTDQDVLGRFQKRRRNVKKLLLATVAVLGFSAGVAQADYAAIAAGYGGSWYVYGYGDMESARAEAKRLCRNSGYGSCEKSTAEESWWYYAAGVCGGEPYTAASQHSWSAAAGLVRAKGAADGRYGCRIFQKE